MMTSPYLDRPLLLLAVALPQMLAKIEAALAAAGLAEKWRLRQPAEEPLTPLRSTTPPAKLRCANCSRRGRCSGSDEGLPQTGHCAPSSAA
jgi:hypothetical protein